MQAVILAGGSSSRFWPLSANRHKALFKLAGRPLIAYTLESLEEAGIEHAVVVQSPEKRIEDELDEDYGLELDFVVQDEPKGMAHALEQAEHLLEDDFLVLTPYRSNVGEFLGSMLAKREEAGVDMVLLGAETDTPEKYGIMDVDGDRVRGVVEKPDPDEAPSDLKVVGLYLLPADFFEYLDRTERHEYQYEDALDMYAGENDVRCVVTERSTASVKYPWDLFGVVREIFDGLERDISDGAEIADSARIEGSVIIEESVRVYENAVIRGPCYIGEDCVIGNNAVVRNHTSLEEGVVVGANTEVRGSLVQEGTHMHQAFVGDSLIGRNVRVGAGTVFTNRGVRIGGDRATIKVRLEMKDKRIDTGLDRLGGIVGDRADIGTQVNVMPGIEVGSNAFVGPSTALFENVGSNEKVYTRFEYVRKER